MRASTLFALTIAVLIGLSVAIAARVSGIFQHKPPDPPAKQEIKILVAAKNIFADNMIDTSDVQVRPLRADELAHFQEHKEEYLPAVANAVYLRVAKLDLTADQPLLKRHLKDMAKPEALHERLMPAMRAISVSLNKDQTAGGQIQVGEWVDVLLTTTIEDGAGKSTTRTAAIAQHVRVIAKRNTLWPVFAALPKDQALQFTLEVNPYRAALIEFGKTKGDLTLTPLPTSEQKRLESQRAALLDRPGVLQQVVFLEPGTAEAQEEENRVAAFNRGELSVSESDLVRIFGITTQPPPVQRITIQQIGGLNHYAPAVFSGATNQRILPKRAGEAVDTTEPVTTSSISTGFSFRSPGSSSCQKAPGKG